MDLLEKIISQIVPQDAEWRGKAKARLDQLTMPHWALGRLMDLAVDLAGITRSLKPPVGRKAIVVMAGDHGVCAEGVSKYPSEVTPQMVHNFVNGGAGINALARKANARVVVVDMGVAADLEELAKKKKIISKKIGKGTKNMAIEKAMSREDAFRSIAAGIEMADALSSEVDIFGTGDMGIGNTTPSAAIIAAITGKPVAEIAGRGTGVDDEQLRHKISIIENSLSLHKPDPADGLDVLSKVGGFEIGGIAGLILGAAARKKPVVIDGFISSAGALIARAIARASCDYMIAAHRSMEKGHQIALEFLGKKALLDLDLRLGEGTGAALAMHFVEAGAAVLTEVATFAEAEVSKADK